MQGKAFRLRSFFSTHRSAILSGLLVAIWFVSATIFVVIPGRTALALQERQLGSSWLVWWLVGVSIDFAKTLYYAMGCSLVSGILFYLLVRFRVGGGRALLEAARVATFVGTLVLLAFLLVHVGVSEFRYERGVYPSPYDLASGLGDADFVSSSLPTYLQMRYLPLELLAIGAILLAFVAINRIIRRADSRGIVLAVSMVVTLLAGQFGFRFYLKSSTFFPEFSDRALAQSPLDLLERGRGLGKRVGGYGGPLAGIRTLMRHVPTRLSSVNSDGSFWGFGAVSVDGSCSRHPWARALPGFFDARFSQPAPSGAVVESLTALSKEMFREFSGDPIVWHLILESFRAEDLTGVNRSAPVAIAPTTNSWYQRSQEATSGILAAHKMYEGGNRTSQGVAATFCGIGSLPFGWSLARDFGFLPLRCLPDVLSDAGFAPELFYGSNLRFDRLGDFFHFHGMGTVEERQFSAQGPRGGWGLSDRFLLREMLKRTSRRTGPKYAVALTLSNHNPYTAPSDMPPHLGDTVADAVRGFADVSSEQTKRLITVAYSDFAVGEFFDDLQRLPLAKNSFVLLQADHALLGRHFWDPSSEEGRFASRIPFVLVLPRQVQERLVSDRALQRAAAKAQALLGGTTLSENDIPHLLLALLSASPAINAIPPEWRWTSLGAQGTSSTVPSGVSRGARAWGIGSETKLFFVDESGQRTLGNDPVLPLEEEKDLLTTNAELKPALRFLADFVNVYANRCPSLALIRRTASENRE